MRKSSIALLVPILVLAGCFSYPIPEPPPDPVMANPPPRPPGFENKGWGGSMAGGLSNATGSIEGVPTSSNALVDVRAGIVLPGAIQNVPGAPDPWNTIGDQPFRNHDKVTEDVDTSVRQLDTAASITKFSTPIPGLEAAHSAAVSRFDAAMQDVEQKQNAMNLATDPGLWESAKNQFHDAWEAAQNAYAQAKATGN